MKNTRGIYLSFFLILLSGPNIFSQDNLEIKKSPRPNILLIVADDLGFSDLGAYGGEIATPSIDNLAATGIKFSNFHVLASCSPSRSVLLTGTDNHIAGIGAQAPGGRTPKQKDFPGYEGYLNQQVLALSEVLVSADYRTYHVGKWHLGDEEGQRPHDRGFQESFALLTGGASHYADQIPLNPDEPAKYSRNGQIVANLPSDFYSTKNYTDTVLHWLERDKQSDKPFFAQLAYTAPHDPLHAPRAYIEKYKGVYEEGYEALREKRFLQLKKLGLIANHHELPPFPEVVKRWKSLSEEDQRLKSRDMEIYAAMIDYLDEQIGRVYQWLLSNDALDNTFIVFMSDNGANGMPREFYPSFNDEFARQFDDRFENRGMPHSFTDIGAGWAIASSCAFQLFKHSLMEGGIRAPMIIKPHLGLAPGIQTNLVQQFIHVKDLMPTFLAIAKAPHPASENKTLKSMSGHSILPLLNGQSYSSHLQDGIGYELHGNRAYFKDEWKILQVPIPLGSGDWQLYNLEEDPAEIHDLALVKPRKVEELLEAYAVYEEENGVVYDLPLFLGNLKRAYQGLVGLILILSLLSIFGKIGGKLKTKYKKWGYSISLVYGLAGVESMALVALFTPYNRYAAWLLVLISTGVILSLLGKGENWKIYVIPLLSILSLGLILLFKSGLLMAMIL
ncbi:MAG: arylsulfatase [Bacteroidota bacterium]